MNFETLKIAVALPQIFIGLAGCVILLLGVSTFRESTKSRKKSSGSLVRHFLSGGFVDGNTLCYWLSIAALLITAGLSAFDFSAPDTLAFNTLFIADPLAKLLNVSICLLSATAFIYSRQYNQTHGIFQGEYYVLGLFAVTGMMIMASANHLLILYLGLELMSLCLYAMIAYYRDNELAAEAAMKYFVLGALASSILLYGMSLLYGLTGSLQLSVIASALTSNSAEYNDAAIALAVVFIIVALAFKLGAVPFHMWVPDVYHGSPTSTTAFLSAAPKIAAFAITIRLLVGGLGELNEMWQPMLIIIALLSVGVGNFVAIAQSNLKRMLAYSTIAHMGFFWFGIASGTVQGYSASLFYVLIYALMGIGGFGLILYAARRGHESDQLTDFQGLAKSKPWFSLLVLILMLSMAGIPPTAGFFAKLAVISALVQSDLVWVAVIAVLFAVVGAFYYLRIIKLVYFSSPSEDQDKTKSKDEPANTAVRTDLKLLLSFNALLLIVMLPWVNSLIAVCNEVILRFSA